MATQPADNHALAARARQLADEAGTGSLARKAAGCAGVALSHSKTPAGARRILTTADLPDEVREAALQVLAELCSAVQSEHQDGEHPART